MLITEDTWKGRVSGAANETKTKSKKDEQAIVRKVCVIDIPRNHRQ